MARSQLAAAAVLTMVVCVSTAVPALAEGTWPASVQLASSAAFPGDTVSFSGQGPVAVGSGTCLVVLDKTLLAGADCLWDQAGTISGSFTVPADAATGVTAAVSICWPGCYDDSLDDVFPDYWQANVGLRIVAPFFPVPDVTCLPEQDATAQLTEAGFEVLVDHKIGDVVTDQEPRPGSLLQHSVPVVVFLHGALVPDLGGRTYEEARVTLEASCLAISAVDGVTDGTVELQDPGVDAVVAGGTTVNVTMSGSTTLPTPTPTPPTPVTAGPNSDPDPDPAADSVSFPVAGTALALALLLALLLAVRFAASLLTRAIQGHRQTAWVAGHVTVTPRPGPGPVFEIRPRDERNRDHVITVVPEEVRRSTTVEENPS